MKHKTSSTSLAILSFIPWVVFALPCAADWIPSNLWQFNGDAARISLPAQYQVATGDIEEPTMAPFLAYMPEKDEVLLMFAYWPTPYGAFKNSYDRGATWSKQWYRGMGPDGKPLPWQLALAYLGDGRLATGDGLVSEDYGQTWTPKMPVINSVRGTHMYRWDPMLVDRDPKTGRVTRLTLAGYIPVGDTNSAGSNSHSQACIEWSTDEGTSWSQPLEVPRWQGVNEVALTRARNGNLVAACRTDNPERYINDVDAYCGLAVSISKDNGKTWSKLNHLYEYGRHHPSMVVMPDGDIVMSYIVRVGYLNTPDGYPQSGIEAVVSHDNGKTWDLDHRYILASFKCTRKGDEWYYQLSQCTSTVVLPDQTLLTAFSPGCQPSHKTRAVDVVRWRLNSNGLNRNHTISKAPWDSDKRNRLDPGPLTIRD
jgi:hypothetical protein